MESDALSLTLAQQFQLTVYEKEVMQMSREQAQDMLLKVLEQMMVKENVTKALMKQSL